MSALYCSLAVLVTPLTVLISRFLVLWAFKVPIPMLVYWDHAAAHLVSDFVLIAYVFLQNKSKVGIGTPEPMGCGGWCHRRVYCERQVVCGLKYGGIVR